MDIDTHLFNAGISIGDVDLSRIGVWQRLPTTDKPTKRNGRVHIFATGPLRLFYQNFATGVRGYCSEAGGFVSRDDLRVMRAAREQSHRERARCRAAAADRAKNTWRESAAADPEHPYLVRKQVQPHGVHQIEQHLFVPMWSGGAICSGQTISPDGEKRFITGGRKSGCYFPIGSHTSRTLLLCEGFATGASLHQCLGLPVAVCFDAGNLFRAGEALRRKLPGVRFIFCADNDIRTLDNPGVTSAKRAAAVTNGFVMVPEFGLTALHHDLTDFNDMHCRYGAEFVREQFAAVLSCQA